MSSAHNNSSWKISVDSLLKQQPCNLFSICFHILHQYILIPVFPTRIDEDIRFKRDFDMVSMAVFPGVKYVRAMDPQWLSTRWMNNTSVKGQGTHSDFEHAQVCCLNKRVKPKSIQKSKMTLAPLLACRKRRGPLIMPGKETEEEFHTQCRFQVQCSQVWFLCGPIWEHIESRSVQKTAEKENERWGRSWGSPWLCL